MKRFYPYILLSILIFTVSGCGHYGLIYSHVKHPLDTNMEKTPVQIKSAEGSIRHVIVITQAGICFQLAWSSAAIEEIAQKNGIRKVFYTDLEETRILSLFHTYTVHIYGE